MQTLGSRVHCVVCREESPFTSLPIERRISRTLLRPPFFSFLLPHSVPCFVLKMRTPYTHPSPKRTLPATSRIVRICLFWRRDLYFTAYNVAHSVHRFPTSKKCALSYIIIIFSVSRMRRAPYSFYVEHHTLRIDWSEGGFYSLFLININKMGRYPYHLARSNYVHSIRSVAAVLIPQEPQKERRVSSLLPGFDVLLFEKISFVLFFFGIRFVFVFTFNPRWHYTWYCREMALDVGATGYAIRRILQSIEQAHEHNLKMDWYFVSVDWHTLEHAKNRVVNERVGFQVKCKSGRHSYWSK